MDQRDRKELLGESRYSSLFSPLLVDRWIWVETLVIALLAVGLCYWIEPEDPFFIRAEFPWLWFAPVLVALRYGVTAGVASSLVILGAWFVLARPDAGFPRLYFLGGIILTMVCGEYSATWRTRLRRVGELNAYLSERFARIHKQLNVVRLSHDQLEHDLITKPATLRDALIRLRSVVALRSTSEPLPGAQDVLVFLAQQCQIEVGAFYVADGTSWRRHAAIGDPPPLDPGDPLLAYALEKQSLAHVQTEGINRTLPTDHLVAAPLVSSAGETLGVLVVSQLPFFALNEDSLQVLSLMLGLYADGIVVAPEVRDLLRDFPACPFEFAEEIAKLRRIAREYRINSHAVMLVFGAHPMREDMLLMAERLKRRFDVYWRVQGPGDRIALINLMPLAGGPAVTGYLDRIEFAIQEQFGGKLRELSIVPQVINVSDPEPLAPVRRLIQGEASTEVPATAADVAVAGAAARDAA